MEVKGLLMKGSFVYPMLLQPLHYGWLSASSFLQNKQVNFSFNLSFSFFHFYSMYIIIKLCCIISLLLPPVYNIILEMLCCTIQTFNSDFMVDCSLYFPYREAISLFIYLFLAFVPPNSPTSLQVYLYLIKQEYSWQQTIHGTRVPIVETIRRITVTQNRNRNRNRNWK